MPLSLGLSITLFFLTALLTWGWIKIAQIKNINDTPERRRLHQTPIPRAGGISIALVMIATSVFIFFKSDIDSDWVLVSTTLILYSLLGFWDDLKPLRSGTKLLLHVMVALVIFLIAIFVLSTFWIASITICVAYLLFVNIWNFMDGSNGLVSMQSLIVVIGFVVLSFFSISTYYFALALAVACLGFLPFNFPVAKVFLGDVGSHVLGAAVTSLAVLAYYEGQWTLLEILCLTSAMWIDAGLTFIRRAFRGFKVTQAHRSHLYQYAIRSGKSHVFVCWYYAIWTLVMIIIIGFSRLLPESRQHILLLAVITSACVLHQWLRLFVLKSPHRPRISKP